MDVVLPEEDYMISRNSKTLSIVEDPYNGISPDEDENVDLGAMSHGTEHFRGIVNLVHGFRELDDVGGMGLVSSKITSIILIQLAFPLLYGLLYVPVNVDF